MLNLTMGFFVGSYGGFSLVSHLVNKGSKKGSFLCLDNSTHDKIISDNLQKAWCSMCKADGETINQSFLSALCRGKKTLVAFIFIFYLGSVMPSLVNDL